MGAYYHTLKHSYPRLVLSKVILSRWTAPAYEFICLFMIVERKHHTQLKIRNLRRGINSLTRKINVTDAASHSLLE